MTHKNKLTLGALLIAFFATYSYIWFFAANTIEERLLDEVEFLRSKSLIIDHGPITVHGFPFHIDIEIDGLYVTSSKNDQYALSIEGPLHGTGSLFNPSKVMLFTEEMTKIVDAKGTSETQSGVLILSAKQTQVLLNFEKHAASDELQSAKTIQVFLNNADMPIFGLKSDRVSFKVDRSKVDPFLTDYTVDAKDVLMSEKIVETLPDSISHAHLEFSVKGKLSPELPMQQFIMQWYDTEGMIDVSQLILEWGTIKVAGSGSISLDESLQPISSFATEFIGLEDTLTILSDQGIINKAVREIVLLGLSPFKEKRETLAGSGSEIYHKLSLSVQSNGKENDFIIGSIPVFRFPHIDWKSFAMAPKSNKVE